MHELDDQLRRYAESAPPVTVDDVLDRVAVRGRRRTRRSVLAAAAAVVVVAGTVAIARPDRGTDPNATVTAGGERAVAIAATPAGLFEFEVATGKLGDTYLPAGTSAESMAADGSVFGSVELDDGCGGQVRRTSPSGDRTDLTPPLDHFPRNIAASRDGENVAWIESPCTQQDSTISVRRGADARRYVLPTPDQVTGLSWAPDNRTLLFTRESSRFPFVIDTISAVAAEAATPLPVNGRSGPCVGIRFAPRLPNYLADGSVVYVDCPQASDGTTLTAAVVRLDPSTGSTRLLFGIERAGADGRGVGPDVQSLAVSDAGDIAYVTTTNGAVSVAEVRSGGRVSILDVQGASAVLFKPSGDNGTTTDHHLRGPLAGAPLSDDPLPMVDGVAVDTSDAYDLVVTSSKVAGKELSLTLRRAGDVGAGGAAFTPRRALEWATSGSAAPDERGVAHTFGVTRQEVATIELALSTGVVRGRTFRSDVFPTLRFFVLEVPNGSTTPQPGQPLPVLVGYNDAGREQIRWER